MPRRAGHNDTIFARAREEELRRAAHNGAGDFSGSGVERGLLGELGPVSGNEDRARGAVSWLVFFFGARELLLAVVFEMMG